MGKDDPSPRATTGSRRPKRILIADDEKGIRFVLRRFLEDTGIFEVETARSGYEAGVKAQAFRPHLLILDHILGDVTSREVVRSLLADDTLGDLKIIVMSGYLTEDEVDAILETGVAGFIRKPFDLKEVKQRILEVLGMS